MLSEMSRTEVAKAREEIRKKLHARIEAFEKDKHTIEFHRFTPYKCPTFAAAAGSGMTCAGRNSLNRYLRATGFFGLEVETSRETEIFYSYVEEKPILSRSIMKLPVRAISRSDVRRQGLVAHRSNRVADSPIVR